MYCEQKKLLSCVAKSPINARINKASWSEKNTLIQKAVLIEATELAYACHSMKSTHSHPLGQQAIKNSCSEISYWLIQLSHQLQGAKSPLDITIVFLTIIETHEIMLSLSPKLPKEVHSVLSKQLAYWKNRSEPYLLASSTEGYSQNSQYSPRSSSSYSSTSTHSYLSSASSTPRSSSESVKKMIADSASQASESAKSIKRKLTEPSDDWDTESPSVRHSVASAFFKPRPEKKREMSLSDLLDGNIDPPAPKDQEEQNSKKKTKHASACAIQ